MFRLYARHEAQDLILKYPIIYACNYPLTYYSAYGYKPLDKVKAALKKSHGKVTMIPNLTNPSSTVETRAQRFLQKFKEVFDNNERCHIVAHSFAGVDIRAMINFYDLQDKVASLSTICSPHNGLTLLDNIDRHPETKNHLLDALRPVGINTDNVMEFLPDVMADINEEIAESERYPKFSFGSRTSQAHLEKMLRYTSSAILDQDTLNENDGITQPDDCRWGHYLLTYEASHYESGGLNSNFNMDLIHGAVIDNIKVTEAKADKDVAERIGYLHQEFSQQ